MRLQVDMVEVVPTWHDFRLGWQNRVNLTHNLAKFVIFLKKRLHFSKKKKKTKL